MQKQIDNSISEKIQKTIIQKETKQKPIQQHEDIIPMIQNPALEKIESISKIFIGIVPFIDWFNSKDKLDFSIYQRDASNWLNSLLERLDTYLFLLDHLANALTHAINGQWNPFLFPDSLLHPLFDTKHKKYILLPFSTHISEILPLTKI